MSHKQTKTLKIEFTAKELNYLDAALRDSARDLESLALEKLGNAPHLFWFTKRLRGKIRRRHEAWCNSLLTKSQKKRIRNFVRDARKRRADREG